MLNCSIYFERKVQCFQRTGFLTGFALFFILIFLPEEALFCSCLIIQVRIGKGQQRHIGDARRTKN